MDSRSAFRGRLRAQGVGDALEGPTIVALGALLVVVTVTVAARLFEVPQLYNVLGAGIPLAVMVICATLTWHLLRRRPVLLVTPLPLALAFCGLTFGFGPLVHFFGAEPVQDALVSRWRLTNEEIFHVQVLNLVGLTCTFLGVVGVASLLPGVGDHGDTERRSPKSRKQVARQGRAALLSNKKLLYGWILCFSAALIVRSPDWLFDVNILSMIPGPFGALGKTGWVAVLLAGVLVGRRGGITWLFLLPPLILEVIVGGLALSRTDVLMPIVMAFIGLFVARRKLQILVIGFLVVTSAYVVTRPLVDVARNEVWQGGSYTAAEFYVAAARGNIDLNLQKGIQTAGWWTRFDYTPIQNELIERYNKGQHGDTFRDLPWIFAPRALFPGKPIIDHGRQVTDLLFGFDMSSTGVTPFAEAYWNGGWLYVVLSSTVMGTIIAMVTIACVWLFSQASIVSWIVGIYGISMGRLVRNFFTSGVMASFVVFVFLLGVYMVWKMVVPSRVR